MGWALTAPALLLVPGEDWPAIAAALDASGEPWPLEAARVDLVWWLGAYGCADVETLAERWRRNDGWVRALLRERHVRALGGHHNTGGPLLARLRARRLAARATEGA